MQAIILSITNWKFFVLQTLMNKLFESPHDCYIKILPTHWPPYIQLLLRSNIVQRHPDNCDLIRLVAFHAQHWHGRYIPQFLTLVINYIYYMVMQNFTVLQAYSMYYTFFLNVNGIKLADIQLCCWVSCVRSNYHLRHHIQDGVN